MNKSFSDDFSVFSGMGVRVAIIDSGLNQSKHQIKIRGGINFTSDKDNIPLKERELSDHIGHGTACAGVIYKKAPNVEIFPVKIFDMELVTDYIKLVKAIEWCIENKMNIINLSLGTTESDKKDVFQNICDRVNENGIYLVAATSNDRMKSYPASLKNVWGVNAGRIKGKYDFFFDSSNEVQFIARGDRQRLDWLDGQEIFLGGTSFAAPHITGLLALILEKHPGVTFDELNGIFTDYSLSEPPEKVDGLKEYSIPGMPVPAQKSNVRLSELHQQNDIQWIQKAVIYPFNKEMHSLDRFRHLLSFEIGAIVDVVGMRTIGKDAGDVIGAEKSGIIIQKGIVEALDGADTLVLGYLDEISRIKRRDVLKEMLELAVQRKKNVYSLTPITKENYPELFKDFKRNGLHLSSPVVTYNDFEKITKTFRWNESSRKPVVGVFGTSPQQGKFTVQLALRQELRNMGYKVGQMGTEHQSALFGFDYTFPNGYDGFQNVRIPMDLHIPLMQSVMAGIENEDPDIVIVGGQSGIIPYSYAEKSQVYTLSSILLLLGTIPDAYIVVVNSIDEPDFIEESIRFLKCLGKGDTVCLVFSDKKKIVSNHLGRTSIVHQPLSDEEIAQTIERFEQKFQIPATEVVSEKGRKKMAVAVEDFFSKE